MKYIPSVSPTKKLLWLIKRDELKVYKKKLADEKCDPDCWSLTVVTPLLSCRFG